MSGFLTHGKKGHLKNFFEIFLWLEASKIDQSIVVGWDRDWGRWGCDCKCPRPQVNVPFYFIKMPFYSQNCPFIFQNCSFIFKYCLFLSWNHPFVFKVPFHFSKMVFCFPELSFSISEMLYFYLLFTSFSKKDFFLCDYIFSLSCSKLLREIIIALLLFCFLFQLYLFTYLLNLSSVSFILGRKTKSPFKSLSN